MSDKPTKTQWFYTRQRRRIGPVSSAQLRELAARGLLAPTDMLLREGQAKWVPAAKVKGLVFGAPVLVEKPTGQQGAPDADWFYARNNQSFGPFSFARLRELADAGRLTQTDWVLGPQAENWAAAWSTPGLFPGAAVATPCSPDAFDSRHEALSEAQVVPDALRPVRHCSYNCPVGIDVRAHAWRGSRSTTATASRAASASSAARVASSLSSASPWRQ
ncbi:MAG: DUF4339 domain-containing protein [Gemmataceae bacterium]